MKAMDVMSHSVVMCFSYRVRSYLLALWICICRAGLMGVKVLVMMLLACVSVLA